MYWIKILQAIIAILLMIVILMQNRGSGLSEVFGGSGNVFKTKRGVEKTLFSLTIIFAVLFFTLSLLNIVL